jgi:hypothetical protein
MVGTPTADRTGTDIDAWCSKCKLVLSHIIIAMKATKVARTECKTCHATHAYKASAPKPRAARKSTAKGAHGGVPLEYDKLLKGRDISSAQPYATSSQFAEGDVIDHSTFALGVVARVLADLKIEVMFPDRPRILIHGRV